MEKVLKIATRGSNLALVQFDIISSILRDNGIGAEKFIVKSYGDIDSKNPLYEAKEQGIFVKRLNDKILEGEVVAAVHSAKDIPYEIDPYLEISYFSARGDVRDCFVGNDSLFNFSGTVGSSSIRRQMFLKLFNRELRFQNVRGNIETRIRKWQAGEVQSLVIAKVALDRLGLNLPGEAIPEKICPPGPNQGFIAVVTKKNSWESKFFKKIQEKKALWEASVERETVGRLELGCSSAISIRGNFRERTINFSFANEDRRYDLSFNEKIDQPRIKRMKEIIYG